MGFNLGNMRNSMNENPIPFVAVAVAVMAVGLFFIARSSGILGQSTPKVQAFFYDEDTNEIKEGNPNDIAPLVGAKGNESVVRVVYNCWDCKDKRVAYYEKYEPKAKEMLEKMQKMGPEPTTMDSAMYNPMIVDQGRWIRSPEPGSKWVRALSAEGEKIIEASIPKQ